MYQTLSVKYFQVLSVTSKIFQVNHQSNGSTPKPWLNTKAIGTEGPVTKPLELAVIAIASATGLLTIIVRAISQEIGVPTPIDKMISSIIRPLTPVEGSRFWSLVANEVSPAIELPASIISKTSPATSLLTPIFGVESLAIALPSPLNLSLFLSFLTKP